MRSNPKREFIRHTADVPLEIEEISGEAPHEGRGVNVSVGGLAYLSNSCPSEGQIIELRIPTVDPPFEARGRIAWCRPENTQFLVGVQFLEASDAFRARMVQQVCSIERYRREVEEEEGRSLSPHEAAAEWIKRFGGRFPDART